MLSDTHTQPSTRHVHGDARHLTPNRQCLHKLHSFAGIAKDRQRSWQHGESVLDPYVASLTYSTNSYYITLDAFQPIFSKLSEIFGRKSMLSWGLALFFIGSILCGISNSMLMLILSRYFPI
ncbi:hypothetical protein BC938DRAFT_481408 [Jimgerdemannia flammicorona]|uniref:Major facilitator superfamily (MFS) profile domain-containing protein n=1 Tax=Jimgerdemannia flammicorona TaxID=994334 RepID=A0A433QG72_9FUNG|nr:hypothetical protein BC938DRAFT_481408 [Jimgerdemannia flammicorona]